MKCIPNIHLPSVRENLWKKGWSLFGGSQQISMCPQKTSFYPIQTWRFPQLVNKFFALDIVTPGPTSRLYKFLWASSFFFSNHVEDEMDFPIEFEKSLFDVSCRFHKHQLVLMPYNFILKAGASFTNLGSDLIFILSSNSTNPYF